MRHSLASDSFPRNSQDGSLGGAPPAEEERRTSTAAGQSRRPRCRPRCSARRGRGARKRPRRSTSPRPGAPVGPASASVSVPRPSSSSGPARSRLPNRRRLVVPSGAVVVVVGRSGAESRRRDRVVRGNSVPSRFRLQVPRATGGACRGSSPVPRYTTRRLRPSISPRLSQLSQFGGHGMPRRPVASSCSSSSRSGSCRSSSSSGGT